MGSEASGGLISYAIFWNRRARRPVTLRLKFYTRSSHFFFSETEEALTLGVPMLGDTCWDRPIELELAKCTAVVNGHGEKAK